jgi:hypothetical protein
LNDETKEQQETKEKKYLTDERNSEKVKALGIEYRVKNQLANM